MGFNIIAVPLTLLIDPRLAPVPMLFVSVVLTSLMVMREPAHSTEGHGMDPGGPGARCVSGAGCFWRP